MFGTDQSVQSPIKSHAEWAEIFGRKTIDGMIEGRSVEHIEHFARLAGSYARMHLDQHAQHRAEVLAWYAR